MLNSGEHDELIFQFEKDNKGIGRTDKEEKSNWSKGVIYQDGNVNDLFKIYRMGYAYGKCYQRLEML